MKRFKQVNTTKMFRNIVLVIVCGSFLSYGFSHLPERSRKIEISSRSLSTLISGESQFFRNPSGTSPGTRTLSESNHLPFDKLQIPRRYPEGRIKSFHSSNQAVRKWPEPVSDWHEPDLDWSEVLKTLGNAWEFHLYFFSTANLFIAVLGLFNTMCIIKHGNSKSYLILMLNVLLSFHGLARVTGLLVDLHSRNETGVYSMIMQSIWALGNPCLSATFLLLIVSVMDITHVALISDKVRKLPILQSFIIIHFTVTLATHVMVTWIDVAEAKVLLLANHIINAFCVGTLGLLYCYVAYRIDTYQRGYFTKIFVNSVYASGILLLALFGFYINSAVQGYLDKDHYSAWTWWTMQTAMRLVEVLSCAMVFVVLFLESKSRMAQRRSFKKMELASRTQTTASDVIIDFPLEEIDPCGSAVL